MAVNKRNSNDSKIWHQRAETCRRLAFGVGDPKFAKILTKLADEYDARAALPGKGANRGSIDVSSSSPVTMPSS
jgi:hypothetical protein